MTNKTTIQALESPLTQRHIQDSSTVGTGLACISWINFNSSLLKLFLSRVLILPKRNGMYLSMFQNLFFPFGYFLLIKKSREISGLPEFN